MAANYSKYHLPAVAVNASTLTPALLEDIVEGKYKIVISSPECYKDNNKLRPAVLSDKLSKKRHVTIVDEAHCIWTWGASGFRKDFERIGDMRVFMPNPNSPMCTATATLSSQVRDSVVRSLHIRPNYFDINLGN
ncbi:ATP-dependent DNA helicase sgs1 [Ceratobasidium sp. 370]|nr:ATP-dependent DNA helicase sgs1 [Ceratobasidium sp. 370]